jgi:hypothetical protein
LVPTAAVVAAEELAPSSQQVRPAQPIASVVRTPARVGRVRKPAVSFSLKLFEKARHLPGFLF